MPRPRKGPHFYRRKGRPGLWAYLDRDNKDLPLGTDDEVEGLHKLAELVERHQPGGVPATKRDAAGSLGPIFLECERRALTDNAPKTAYEIKLNLRRIGLWLIRPVVPRADGMMMPRATVERACDVDAQLVADYRAWRRASRSRGVADLAEDEPVPPPAPISAARINRELDAWKRAMEIAIEQREADSAILAAFEHLREAHPEPHTRVASRRELQAFLKAVDSIPLRALFRLTLATALRDEEVRHLEAGDLRADAVVIGPKPPGTCTCCPAGWKSKGYRYRTIPAKKPTLDAARSLIAAQAAGWRIPCERWVWEQMQRASASAKIAPLSMHDLRHAGASHWLDAGIKIATISKWLGHRDVLTTQRYLHVVADDRGERRKMPW